MSSQDQEEIYFNLFASKADLELEIEEEQRFINKRAVDYTQRQDRIERKKLEIEELNQLIKQADKQYSQQADDVCSSNNLQILNDAAEKFWRNADKEQKDTHPANGMVKEWLMEQGYRESLAVKAATIIRPEWAAKGRR